MSTTSFTSPEMWKKYSMGIKLSKTLLTNHKQLIHWKENPSILEIGYGDGSTSKECLMPLIPKNYKEFIATDSSQSMVEYMKENVVIPRGDFRQLDITSRDIPVEFHNRFDNIFGLFVLHWVKDNTQAFINIHKMLKVGGQTFQIRFAPSPTDSVFLELSKHPKWGKYNQKEMMSQYGDKENPIEFIKKDLINAGFKNIVYVMEEISNTYPNEETYDGGHLSVNPSIAHIPKDLQEEYKKCFLETSKKYSTIIPNGDGTNSYFSKAKVYIISATKV